MIYFTFEVLFSFIEAYLLYDLLNFVLLSNRKYNNYKRIGLSILTTILVLFLNSFNDFSMLTLLAMPIFSAVMAAFFLKINLNYSILLSLCYILVLHFYDSIFISAIGVFWGQENLMQIILKAGSERIMIGCIIKGIFIVIYLILRKVIEIKKVNLNAKYMLGITIGGLLGAVYLSERTLQSINEDIALSWLFFTVSIVLLAVVIYYYMQQKIKKKALEFAEIRNEILEQNYNNIKTIYESNSKLSHDFKNHISVIQQLTDEENYSELKEYISGLKLSKGGIFSVNWANDTVVNFIINNKIADAKEKNIKVQVKIDYPIKTNIRSNDVTTILANLFDNAIEACEKYKKDLQKSIDIMIKPINSMLVIKIMNTCDQRPIIKHGEILTSKKDNVHHGWGLKSVKSTVEKYNGFLEYNYCDEGNKFTVTVSLFFEQYLN